MIGATGCAMRVSSLRRNFISVLGRPRHTQGRYCDKEGPFCDIKYVYGERQWGQCSVESCRKTALSVAFQSPNTLISRAASPPAAAVIRAPSWPVGNPVSTPVLRFAGQRTTLVVAGGVSPPRPAGASSGPALPTAPAAAPVHTPGRPRSAAPAVSSPPHGRHRNPRWPPPRPC